MTSRRQTVPATTAPRSRGPEGFRNIDLSSAQLGSSGIARDINRDIVLELIRFRQPVSRVDLSRISGLQPSTISAIVEELIEEKWVKNGAVIQGLRGRPSTMLSVNEDLVTLAMDLRPDRAILAIVDLTGRFLSQETVMISSKPEPATARIIERMQHLRNEYAHKTFEGFDLKTALEKGLKLQVEMDNDANVCLLSELWFGRLEGVRNAVLIAVSEGLGTAILAGGQLQSGFNGLAGEFGHIPVDSSGAICGCGQRGCWETVASSRAALHFYRELEPKAKLLNIQQLLLLAEEGDKSAEAAVLKQSQALGRGLRLITAALSPEVILITGEITSCWKKFGPVVQKELESSVLIKPAPRLATAGDGYLARLSGAAAMLLQRHSGYHRSTRPSGTRKQLPAKVSRQAERTTA